MSALQRIADMHKHFNISPERVPFSDEETRFRATAMIEEVEEFRDAENEEQKLDALVDLFVFALGTIDRMGMLYGIQTFLSAVYRESAFEDIDFSEALTTDDFMKTLCKLSLTAGGKMLIESGQIEAVTESEMARVFKVDLFVTNMVYEVEEYSNHMNAKPRKAGEAFEMCCTIALTAGVTAGMLGYGKVFFDAFDRVMDANMQKQIGSQEKRHSFEIDLVKPEGWTAPDLSDLVAKREY